MPDEQGPLVFISPQSPEAQVWLDKVNDILRPSVDAALKKSMGQFFDHGFAITYVDAEFLGHQLRPKGGSWFKGLFTHGVDTTKPESDPIHNAIRKTRNA